MHLSVLCFYWFLKFQWIQNLISIWGTPLNYVFPLILITLWMPICGHKKLPIWTKTTLSLSLSLFQKRAIKLLACSYRQLQLSMRTRQSLFNICSFGLFGQVGTCFVLVFRYVYALSLQDHIFFFSVPDVLFGGSFNSFLIVYGNFFEIVHENEKCSMFFSMIRVRWTHMLFCQWNSSIDVSKMVKVQSWVHEFSLREISWCLLLKLRLAAFSLPLNVETCCFFFLSTLS